ncbi:MAG TPA: aldehyde dehydrogenase family protein [Roseiflexaceae bacterium]|nr:aldehyde dehydrogenase family protein [Roseiflexaceae bacterium]
MGDVVNPDLPRFSMYIDGRWVDAESGAVMPVNEPAHERPMAYVARGNAADVDRAVQAARAAFDRGPWPHTPGHERGRILAAIAELIEEHTAELAEAETRNLGVPLRKSTFVDVPWSAEHFRVFAELARTHPYEPLPWNDVPSVSWNFVWREPIGVCGQIVPWNYPLLMAVWKIAPALAAGNTIVLKPASYTPITALMLTRLIDEAGLLPRGVLNVVTGPGGEVGDALARHPGVDKISFTGSTETGRHIMRMASDTIKSLTLELGGKSPSLVLPDADMELATDGVLFGVFFNGGQSCEAGTRCLVPERLHDEFIERLVARARQLRLGDPLDLETDQGPLVSELQCRSVEEYIAIGKREGARLVTGGTRARVPGLPRAPFIEPTIFTNVKNGTRLAQEEIFGPVLAVIPYRTVSEAIELANQTHYGLGAAVWSRDLQGAIEVAKRIRTGTVWINDHHIILPRAPFGGYKQSGIGREHGLQGLLAYTEVKHIHVDLMQKREGRVHWDVLLPGGE